MQSTLALSMVALKCGEVALGLEMGCVPSSVCLMLSGAPWGTTDEGNQQLEPHLSVSPVLIKVLCWYFQGRA